ncbi:MAG: hypothetical protein ABI169_06465 [Chitinophagaceae bacterium]
MKNVLELANQLETFIPMAEQRNERVSQASVGWHIAHALLAIDKSVEALGKSQAADFKPGFSFWKMIVLLTGRIPRGKAKSPKSVVPENEVTAQQLKHQMSAVKHQILRLNSLPAYTFFRHPMFGDLRLKTAKKFLCIHTRHHLAIIQDIVGELR